MAVPDGYGASPSAIKNLFKVLKLWLRLPLPNLTMFLRNLN